ncbi:MAG: hypothetical protein ACK5X3_24205 [Pseudomonadota bacterium]
MARNGSGTYNRAVAPYVAGTTITAATVNQEMDDIATALTGSMARDGQSPATANIPMGGFRLTDLGNAIANTDAAALGQVLAKAGDTATGALGVIAGTAAAPGVFVSGDTNTGLFQPSADTLAVTVGGAEVARFGANGLQSASPWVDLASAATTDLGAQTTDNLRITGTTTITSFGVAPNGVTRHLRFADVTTITYNATSLITPGLANITTAAGDTGTAKSLGAGNWVLTDWQRAAALPVLPGLIMGSGLTMATGRLLGRVTAATGAIEEIPLGNTAAAISLSINLGTEQATNTSQVQYDFTSIPAGVRRVTVMLNGVSTNGGSGPIIQLGTSGGITSSGYNSVGTGYGATINSTTYTTGFGLSDSNLASNTFSGAYIFILTGSNVWTLMGMARRAAAVGTLATGSIGLSAALDRLRLTTVNGTDTFDAGTINISWEF